jgi:hypothetical protein|tara:strand:+ start:178 stop:366 length:189 start_codon:yes stop_codon:yes gene_type:complete
MKVFNQSALEAGAEIYGDKSGDTPCPFGKPIVAKLNFFLCREDFDDTAKRVFNAVNRYILLD